MPESGGVSEHLSSRRSLSRASAESLSQAILQLLTALHGSHALSSVLRSLPRPLHALAWSPTFFRVLEVSPVFFNLVLSFRGSCGQRSGSSTSYAARGRGNPDDPNRAPRRSRPSSPFLRGFSEREVLGGGRGRSLAEAVNCLALTGFFTFFLYASFLFFHFYLISFLVLLLSFVLVIILLLFFHFYLISFLPLLRLSHHSPLISFRNFRASLPSFPFYYSYHVTFSFFYLCR